MKKYGGFIFIIDEPERVKILEEIIQNGQTFTETISSLDWRPKEVELCLISVNGESFSYIALGLRGRKVATLKYSVRFSDFIALNEVPFKTIKDLINKKFKRYFISVSDGIGSRVPPGTWKEIINCIKKIVPGLTKRIETLEAKQENKNKRVVVPYPEITASEKDAIGLALDIFGINRDKILTTWVSDNTSSAPFISGLKEFSIREDVMVFHDNNIFGDWSKVKQHLTGAIEFSQEGEKLTVLNVNRSPIEKALGVDLLYYHHKYKSFILVQYKRMEKEGYGQESSFRPTGKQYNEELSRMKNFKTKYPDVGVRIFDDYRLNSEAFYFKLCPSMQFDSGTTSLIKGMYWPLDGWEMLLKSPAVMGAKGGINITYSNSVRHIDNTLFVRLVQDGWIGSRGDMSKAIELVVKLLLEGHSVTVALSQSMNED